MAFARLLGIVCVLALAAPAVADAPWMSTRVFGMPISFEDCKARVQAALEQEGYGNLRDFGNGFIGFTNTHSASLGCTHGRGETVLTVVVASAGPNTDQRDRLSDLVSRRTTSTPQNPPPSHGTSINWGTNATQHRGKHGQQFTFTCSAGSGGSVWGTDVYTDDSSICNAALHAGLIGSQGGTVTIEMRPGRSSYQASTRNGVTSGSYGAWESSYVFVGAPRNDPPPTHGSRIDWGKNAAEWRGQNGKRVSLHCPPGGQRGLTIWGDDTYTDDSSICTAAVHSGLITYERGGDVLIEIRPGRSSYPSRQRNGVTSTAYGAWGGSFTFLTVMR